MADLLKKVLYTGVGLVSTTTEKMQTLVQELVDKGRISEEEGKKVVEDFLQDTKTKRNEFENRFKEVVERIVSKFNFVPADKVEALNAKLEEMETEGKAVIKKVTKKVEATKVAATKKVTNVTESSVTAVKTAADAVQDAVEEMVEEVK